MDGFFNYSGPDSLGHVHTNPEIFETPTFLIQLHVDGFFNYSGPDSLVLCGRKANLWKKVCGLKYIQLRGDLPR